MRVCGWTSVSTIIDSKAYHFLQNFAKDNELRVLPWEPGVS